MKRSVTISTLISCALSLLTLLNGCKKSGSNSPAPVLPAISSFSPLTDTIGAQVTINGNNFSSVISGNTVKFNGTNAVVNSASSSQLLITIPVGVSPGPISVTVGGQTATSTNSFTPLGPTISGFSNTVAGIGYPVVLNGANFSSIIASNIVTVNGSPSVVSEASATQLTILVPNAATSGKIMVTVKGLSATSSEDLQIKKLVVTTLAGNGNMGSDDGPGNTATFHFPSGIVEDANGDFYVTDTYSNKIRKVTSAGVVSTFAGTGINNHLDGTSATAEFSLPSGIAIDKLGNFYVSEIGVNNIRKISPDGNVSTIAGSIYGSAGSDDGIGTAASFNDPIGLAVDASNNVYVADVNNNKIRKITPAGVVTTFAGTGAKGSADGSATTATFDMPFSLVFDSQGNLYVTQTGDNKIRKITSAGDVTTIAGSGAQGSSDGMGSAASFIGPTGITIDNSGNLFVTDSYFGKVRLITPAGLVVTVAGKDELNSVDGTGYGASLRNPIGITVDANGNLYVVENGENKIKKILVQ